VLPADEEPAEQQGLRRREEAATAAAAVAGRSLRLLHHVQHPRAHLQAPRLRGASPSWISLCFPLAQKPPARFSSRLVRDLLRCSGFPEMPDACSWLALFFFLGGRIAGRASSGPTGSAATTRSSTDSSPTAPPSSASR
jgi:hypothetical protein